MSDGIDSVGAVVFDIRMWPSVTIQNGIAVMAIHDGIFSPVRVRKVIATPEKNLGYLELQLLDARIDPAMNAKNPILAMISLKYSSNSRLCRSGWRS